MVTKKSRKPSKKVKSLPAKRLNTKQAKGVKGGDKATFNDFNFTHNIDKASPVLFQK